MQSAHFTSAAIFWAGGGEDCPSSGNSEWHDRSAALNLGSLLFRSLPGPALIWNATPPPGLGMGSGKSEIWWPRMQRAYATARAIASDEFVDEDLWLPAPDPEAATPGLLCPPQAAPRNANPSTEASIAVQLTGRAHSRLDGRGTSPERCSWLGALVKCRLLCGFVPSRSLYTGAPYRDITEAVTAP